MGCKEQIGSRQISIVCGSWPALAEGWRGRGGTVHSQFHPCTGRHEIIPAIRKRPSKVISPRPETDPRRAHQTKLETRNKYPQQLPVRTCKPETPPRAVRSNPQPQTTLLPRPRGWPGKQAQRTDPNTSVFVSVTCVVTNPALSWPGRTVACVPQRTSACAPHSACPRGSVLWRSAPVPRVRVFLVRVSLPLSGRAVGAWDSSMGLPVSAMASQLS